MSQKVETKQMYVLMRHHAYFFALLLSNPFALCAMEQASDTDCSLNHYDTMRALHRAARLGDLAAVQHLIQWGADPEDVDSKMNTPLHKSISLKNNMDVIKELLIARAGVNSENHKQQTALHRATVRGDYEIVKLLLRGHASLDVKDYSLSTPLHYAVQFCSKEVVELLLYKGADSNAQDAQGRSSLHCAVAASRPEIIAFLLSQGAVLELRDSNGCTPLFSARTKEVAELLLVSGADKAVFDNNGMSVVHYLIEMENTCSSKANEQTSSGQCSQEKRPILELLQNVIEAGISVDSVDQGGRSVFQSTALRGDTEILQKLLELGAALEFRDARRNTALHHAVLANQPLALSFLLMRGAQVGAQNNAGETALHVAAIKGYQECSSELVFFLLTSSLLSEHPSAFHRLMTVLLCIHHHTLPGGRLSKELVVRILSADGELAELLSAFYAMDLKKRVRERKSSITLFNNTQWRVRISYAKDNDFVELVLVPGETCVLDVSLARVQGLQLKAYLGRNTGKVGSVFQGKGLDILAGLERKEHVDLNVGISGAAGSLGHYVSSFRLEKTVVPSHEHEPISLIPESHVLLDAFPGIKYKVKMGLDQQKMKARCFLALPRDAHLSSVKKAYERLYALWKAHYFFHPASTVFIDQVLGIIITAYAHHLKDPLGTTLFEYQDLQNSFPPGRVLKDHTREKLSRALMVQFFTRRGLGLVKELESMKDVQGRTPAQCALVNGHGELAQWLSHDLVEDNLSSEALQRIERISFLNKRLLFEGESVAQKKV